MTTPIKQDAAFRYTEDGQDYLHYLGAKLRRPVVNPVQRIYEHRPLDPTGDARRVTIGGVAYDLIAYVRFDGSRQSLIDFVAAARRGAAIEYFPSLSTPALSFPCDLVNADEIRPDSDVWWDNRDETRVVLRRSDGGTWQGVLEAPLLYYRAGNSLPGLTFTRSGSVGPYIDEDGVLQDAAADVFRTDWIDTDGDGVLDTPTLLVESARTNLLLRSAAFDNAAWTKTRSSVTANQGTGGDGTTSADKLIDTIDNNTHFIRQGVTATADVNYALSIVAEADEYDFVGLALTEGAAFANRCSALFDLSDGTVDSTSANGTGAFARAYVEPLVDGRYRLTLVGSVGNGATAIQARVWLADQSGRTVATGWAGDGASGVLIWGAQFEDNAGASSSHIATTSATVTRNADTLYADFLFPPQELTVYAKIRESGTSRVASAGVVHIGSATAGADPRFTIESAGSGLYRVRFDDGTTNTSVSQAAAVSLTESVELRGVLSVADSQIVLGQSIDGAAETTVQAAITTPLPSAWADTRLYIGSRGTSDRGLLRVLAVKVARGVRSMQFMRDL